LKGARLTEGMQVGKRGMNSFPGGKDVSKHHLDVAIMNNYYFVKDSGSKKGSYIKIGGSKNKRVELHKGMTFAVGRLHLKVSNIEGDSADNRKLREKMEEEQREREAEQAEKKREDKTEVELDDDEEFADDSDDEDSKKKSGIKGKLDGPPVMFITSIDKKVPVKGRIRETSTIGVNKEKNKISVKEDIAKPRKVDDVHTRVVLEDGHFYLEDAGSSFGTYVGLPKKKFFEINAGDLLMLGGARATISQLPATVQFLDGLIDKILGQMPLKIYDMKICGTAPIEKRLKAARKEDDDD